MLKPICVTVMCLVSAGSWASAALTETENQWLNAAAPVLDYAEAQALPIDIIVQPTSKPGTVPLAMGFQDGRCKLVFSLRDNPDAGAILGNASVAQTSILIEAMVAHEVAHCWRQLQGANPSPAGFSRLDNGARSMGKEIQQTRREEGFADLVGLAWTLRQHPEHYSEVQAWFVKVRADQSIQGSHHDTLAWVQLAGDSSVFNGAGNLFHGAATVWKQQQ